MVLEFFDSPKKAKVYYGSDLIFNLSVNFDWWAKGLYMAGMKIISGGEFKKINMKNKVYIKITKEV